MINISLDLSNKIPQQTVKIIELVKTVADELNIPVFLVGATARDLVLQFGYNLPKSVATRDIDFAIAIENWTEYDQLKQTLIQTGNFQQDSKVEHRMFEVKTQTEIDIVPFGGIESPQGKITWQTTAKEITTTGFAEAYKSALNVKLSKNLTIKIVSPVGLAILKIIAWNDRHSNKDTSDFWLVAKNYLDIGDNEDRIYEHYPEWLEDADYDYEIAGAKLLGIDIAKISSKTTRSELLGLLSNEKKMEKFVFEIVRLESRADDNFDRVLKIVKSVKDGIAECV